MSKQVKFQPFFFGELILKLYLTTLSKKKKIITKYVRAGKDNRKAVKYS